MIDAVIRYCSRLAPHRFAVASAVGDISFCRLDKDVGALAAHLVVRFGAATRTTWIEIGNPALAWAAAAAAQRVGWTVGFARPDVPAFIDEVGEGSVVLSDAASQVHPATVRLDHTWLTPPASGPLDRRPDAPSAVGQIFAHRRGDATAPFRLSAQEVDVRVGQIDCLLPSGSRMACLIGPETPFGFAVALRHWLRGGCLVTPTPTAPLGGLGPQRRLDLLVTRPAQLAALLEALPPDAAPQPGLRLVVVGGQVSRALTLAARLRLASEVVLIHETDAQGLIAMGIDTIARQDGEVGPLAPWLDADGLALSPDIRLTEAGVLRVEEPVAG